MFVVVGRWSAAAYAVVLGWLLVGAVAAALTGRTPVDPIGIMLTAIFAPLYIVAARLVAFALEYAGGKVWGQKEERLPELRKVRLILSGVLAGWLVLNVSGAHGWQAVLAATCAGGAGGAATVPGWEYPARRWWLVVGLAVAVPLIAGVAYR